MSATIGARSAPDGVRGPRCGVAVVLQAVAEGVESLAAGEHAARPGDVGDPPAPAAHQVVERHPRAAGVVAVDAIDRLQATQLAGAENHRGAQADAFGDARLVDAAAGDDRDETGKSSASSSARPTSPLCPI